MLLFEYFFVRLILVLMVIMMVNSVIYDKQLEELRESKMIKRVLDDDLMFFIMYFVEEYCDDIFSCNRYSFNDSNLFASKQFLIKHFKFETYFLQKIQRFFHQFLYNSIKQNIGS